MEIEKRHMENIIEKYDLKNIYYSLDNNNIFKRVDRYDLKKILIALFSVLLIFHGFEITFNIIMIIFFRKESEDFEDWQRISTSFISLVYILDVLFLSTLTVAKLKIHSYVFY